MQSVVINVINIFYLNRNISGVLLNKSKVKFIPHKVSFKHFKFNLQLAVKTVNQRPIWLD